MYKKVLKNVNTEGHFSYGSDSKLDTKSGRLKEKYTSGILIKKTKVSSEPVTEKNLSQGRNLALIFKFTI